MASDADNEKNTITFNISFKCCVTQNTETPNITKDIKFDVQLTWNNKHQIPLLSTWDTNKHSFDVNIEFTKAKIIEWSDNGIMSIKPALSTKTIDDKGKTKEQSKEIDALKINLSCLLNGSTSFHKKLKHQQLECMDYLNVSIKLNQPIITKSWSKQLIPFVFEICSIEDLPIPNDDTSKTYKPMTILYNLPGLNETVISPSFDLNKQQNIQSVKINFRKTYLLATQLDDLNDFLHKIRYNPIRIKVHNQDFITDNDDDKIDWHMHGQCDFLLNDVFTAKCITEQTQPCYAIFQKNDSQRLDVYKQHFTNLTIKYQILAPTEHLLKLLDDSSLFVRAVYRLNMSEFDLYSNIMQCVIDSNVNELQLKQSQNEQQIDEDESAKKDDEDRKDEIEQQTSEPILSNEELLQNAQVSDDQMSSLDLLTGFELIQNDDRLIVIEGKRNGQRMKELFEKIPQKSRFLMDENIFFQNRLYSGFYCIYKLKLHNSLNQTLNDKSLYLKSSQNNDNHRIVFQKLSDLMQCKSLKTAKHRNLFPSMKEIKSLEISKNAQIVTKDIESTMKESIKSLEIETDSFELIDENFIVNPQSIKGTKPKKQRIPISAIWKTADFKKSYSLKSDSSEQSTDFIQKHVLSYTTNPEILKQRRAQKQKLLESVPDIIVDKDRRNEIENNKKEKRKLFLTSDGWQFYKPKQPKDFIKHPNKPHPARCDELNGPYDDGTDSCVKTENTEDQRPKFNQFTDTHSRLFGMKGNDQFWQSVFCSNEDEQILFVQQQNEQRLKEWNDKLVVDDVIFRVDLKAKSDAVPFVDKFKDILHDTPKKKGLKFEKRIFKNECSQTTQWDFNEMELENRKTITRTQLNPEMYLSEEFDHVHITKPDALHSKRHHLSTTLHDAYTKVTEAEKVSKSKLYGIK